MRTAVLISLLLLAGCSDVAPPPAAPTTWESQPLSAEDTAPSPESPVTTDTARHSTIAITPGGKMGIPLTDAPFGPVLRFDGKLDFGFGF